MERERLKIAVVEDDLRFQKQICEYIARAGAEENVTCQVTCYGDGRDFLNGYTPAVDLIFMDIEMPKLNGMKAARQIREMDQRVGIVFVTNMAQYAIQGYEVNAIDYILKPVEYFTFVYKFKKALRFCRQHRERELVIQSGDSFSRISAADIYYLEKDKNYIVYHTVHGTYRERGTMTEREQTLREDSFVLCNSGCLVNLRYVTRFEQDTLWIGQTVLPVSRQKRKAFVQRLMRYLGR